MIDLTITRIFKDFVTGDLSLNEFERWIKTDASLMQQLDKTDYQSLINFDMGCRDSSIQFELSNLVSYIWARNIDPNKEVELTRNILAGMIEGTVGIIEGCRELNRLFWQGNGFIPIIFVGYDSELDGAIDETSEVINCYREAILIEANKLLLSLK